ncbi:hypothetical protein K505DRAFT_331633 [Melanomma pulvis-pyrius CBS 109.77]|uniref:Uncharacterized protein n=1 Tax=Melanomma pulvis-pyrius CBS 109.77 TaxID=1314802 RepID=A0A6A6XVD4_9PLEO|nr:hypothetical protein K505DRAFT_331633 [Melanomma pulvis-pyrius CBS 109.77]
MDEMGVMISMPSLVKVLVGKDDRRNYRGAGLKRTTVTVVECCSLRTCLILKLEAKLIGSHPCDVEPFAPLKTAYRDQVERLYQGGIDIVSKEQFTYLYSPEVVIPGTAIASHHTSDANNSGSAYVAARHNQKKYLCTS